jgi:hypothetical protein
LKLLQQASQGCIESHAIPLALQADFLSWHKICSPEVMSSPKILFMLLYMINPCALFSTMTGRGRSGVWSYGMPRPKQTREQLMREVAALRQRIAQLEAAAVLPRQTTAELDQDQTRASRGIQSLYIINAFNNVLTVMLGYAELTLHSVPHDSAAWNWLQQVLKAGEHAKELLRELYALNHHAE